GVSHIEYLGSRDGILKAKLEILEGMKKGAPLILNGDNDKLVTVREPDYKLVFFGIENPNVDFRAKDIEEKTVLHPSRSNFTAHHSASPCLPSEFTTYMTLLRRLPWDMK
ncbi:UDP-N-acetylmuramoyl-tripeptide--D-alanyl-D-alanine ligase, partial [human gut metagenome]